MDPVCGGARLHLFCKNCLDKFLFIENCLKFVCLLEIVSENGCSLEIVSKIYTKTASNDKGDGVTKIFDGLLHLLQVNQIPACGQDCQGDLDYLDDIRLEE